MKEVIFRIGDVVRSSDNCPFKFDKGIIVDIYKTSYEVLLPNWTSRVLRGCDLVKLETK